MAQSRLQASLRASGTGISGCSCGTAYIARRYWMQTVRSPGLFTGLTGSPTLLGWSVLHPVPSDGSCTDCRTVADTYPRRRSMLALQATAMLLAFPLAALTLTNRIPGLAHHGSCGVAAGVVNAFDIPVRQSFVAKWSVARISSTPLR